MRSGPRATIQSHKWPESLRIRWPVTARSFPARFRAEHASCQRSTSARQIAISLRVYDSLRSTTVHLNFNERSLCVRARSDRSERIFGSRSPHVHECIRSVPYDAPIAMDTISITEPEPGWYADPAVDGQVRRWDGRAWTDETRPRVSASHA